MLSVDICISFFWAFMRRKWCIFSSLFSSVFSFIIFPHSSLLIILFVKENLHFNDIHTGKAMKGQSQKVQQAVLKVCIMFGIRFIHLPCTYIVTWFINRNFGLAPIMLLLLHQLVKKVLISWKLILSYLLMLIFHHSEWSSEWGEQEESMMDESISLEFQFYLFLGNCYCPERNEHTWRSLLPVLMKNFLRVSIVLVF